MNIPYLNDIFTGIFVETHSPNKHQSNIQLTWTFFRFSSRRVLELSAKIRSSTKMIKPEAYAEQQRKWTKSMLRKWGKRRSRSRPLPNAPTHPQMITNLENLIKIVLKDEESLLGFLKLWLLWFIDITHVHQLDTVSPYITMHLVISKQ